MSSEGICLCQAFSGVGNHGWGIPFPGLGHSPFIDRSLYSTKIDPSPDMGGDGYSSNTRTRGGFNSVCISQQTTPIVDRTSCLCVETTAAKVIRDRRLVVYRAGRGIVRGGCFQCRATPTRDTGPVQNKLCRWLFARQHDDLCL